MTVKNDAVEKFRSGFNCAQAIFSTYSKQFGLDPKLAPVSYTHLTLPTILRV